MSDLATKWTWPRVAILAGVLFASTLLAIACSDFGAEDTTPTCTTCDEGGTSTDAGDGAAPPDGSLPPPGCGAKSYDLATCPCTKQGATTPCYQGVPGPDSGCKDPGFQTCDGTGADLRWTTCAGGTTPIAEICHDNVDNNCDGKIDDGCLCSDSIDICRGDGGVMYPAATYTMFTVPAQPMANTKFDVYVVTKDASFMAPGLEKNGSICYGGGALQPCASPGAGCAGWKVAFFQNIKENAGTYTYRIKDPRGAGGCDGPTIATLMVLVQ